MKFSVITVCFNSVSTIEQTIQSVLNQTYPDIEYIIIDGESDDGTLDIINQYREKITRIVSENDNGIYHAMNKGIAKATGDIICFLNADDFYIHPQVIATAKNSIEKCLADADVFYGNLLVYDQSSGHAHLWKPGRVNKLYLYRGTLPHPAMFYKRNVFNEVGQFDESFKISGDYDWVARAFVDKGIQFKKIDVLPAVFVNGGQSTTEEGHIVSGEEQRTIRDKYFSSLLDRCYFPFRNRVKKLLGV